MFITPAAGFGLALAFLLASAVPAPAVDVNTLSADAAAKAVSEDLDRLKATGFAMQQVKDQAVTRAFPKFVFFGVYFRQFPVARMTPKGLSSSNLYAVGADGKPQLLKEAKQLQGFFQTNLPAAKEDEPAKDAVRAYVRLMQELHQDGFYKFALQDDSTKIDAGTEGKTATGRAIAMGGGNGELGATLTFDSAGRLAMVAETVKLRPGPRPICQATKLLDADPIVRRMAERDLVIMGRAARPYLDEQRAKAAAQLQRAIDRVWQLILDDER